MSARAAAVQPERICANGSVPKSFAQPARYAAQRPSAWESNSPRPGANGWTTAAPIANPSSGTTAGAAAAFAGTASTGIAWNWNQRIGAVATPQAVEMATGSRRRRGSGYPSSEAPIFGASTKIATTAENES